MKRKRGVWMGVSMECISLLVGAMASVKPWPFSKVAAGVMAATVLKYLIPALAAPVPIWVPPATGRMWVTTTMCSRRIRRRTTPSAIGTGSSSSIAMAADIKVSVVILSFIKTRTYGSVAVLTS